MVQSDWMLKSIVREGLCKTRRGEKIKMCQEFSWPVKNPENLDKMRKCRKWNIYYHTQLNPRNNPFHKILSPPLFLSLYLTLSLTHKHTQANACRHTHTHTNTHTHLLFCWPFWRNQYDEVQVVYILQAAFCTYTNSILYMSRLINCLGVDVCVTLPWARGSVPVSLITINDDYLQPHYAVWRMNGDRCSTMHT